MSPLQAQATMEEQKQTTYLRLAAATRTSDFFLPLFSGSFIDIVVLFSARIVTQQNAEDKEKPKPTWGPKSTLAPQIDLGFGKIGGLAKN